MYLGIPIYKTLPNIRHIDMHIFVIFLFTTDSQTWRTYRKEMSAFSIKLRCLSSTYLSEWVADKIKGDLMEFIIIYTFDKH